MSADQDGEDPPRLPGWPAVIAVSLLLVALVAGVALYLRATIGSTDIVGVCADSGRQVRVADEVCARGQPGTTWVYYRVDKIAPAVGQSTSDGIPASSAPTGTGSRQASGGIPAGGGPVVFPRDR